MFLVTYLVNYTHGGIRLLPTMSKIELVMTPLSFKGVSGPGIERHRFSPFEAKWRF